MNEYMPGPEGVPATHSNISFIDGEKGVLSYRGFPLSVHAHQPPPAGAAKLVPDMA